MDKHVSSFERFLSEYKWSMHGVIASLVSLLSSHLGERLMVHGAFLVAEYTTFACKAGKKMIIEIYAARCLLEIAIGDLKQHFGFSDYQSTTSIAIARCATLLHCFLYLEIDVAA